MAEIQQIAQETPVRDVREDDLLRMRIRKYRALAALFRLDLSRYVDSVRALLQPCPGINDCPVLGGVVRTAGEAALRWSTEQARLPELQAEHIRLFGGSDLRKAMPQVSPCAAMYLSEGIDGTIEDVRAVYEASGFDSSHQGGYCEGHISNELDFMAHLFEQALQGDPDAMGTAAVFMTSHLFGWGVVFSAATYSRSEHPVTRFAGLMLEHVLFCELEHVRTATHLSYASTQPGQAAS